METIDIKERVHALEQEAGRRMANTQTLPELEALRLQYFGKKGEISALLAQLGKLPPEERRTVGQLVNHARDTLEGVLSERQTELKAAQSAARLASETLDVTLPGKPYALGHQHPLSQIKAEVLAILAQLGFAVELGPEVEWAYYNFDALNIPEGHPARDTQDTFYFNPQMLLRTQTSSVQIRAMEHQAPPIRMVAPGRVYRSDAADATHSPMFHQIEGLCVDEGVTMANLKWVLEHLCQELFGATTRIRLRPHHFPFTEPSCEVDVSCFKCGGTGCAMCKNEGWVEILGAGMVHPQVLRRCNIDPTVYSGFAFGLGLERLAMFKFEIDDIRLFYENDLRFLQQF